ncbi:hypothetical protein DFR30_0413 [Thiogranum longum]|uniref:Uncharacterized protein n=1 Tax=Thiogranum longum TaxID=1537524 RepID=A0A4R1HJ11_9GAMM|nr:hypothetical protein [Thiogranum longum]TCK17192.1 hypothetical protein DFR30_0413 [Thiogranum longum]
MAYFMDMASGTEFPVEEPSCKLVCKAENSACDTPCAIEEPHLQLAMVEARTQSEARTLPAASVEALIKSLED